MNKPVNHETISFPVPVEGMSCASCVSSVEKAVSKVAGVDKVSVNLATERADVTFKGAPDLPSVIDAIRKAGYEVPAASIDLAIEGMSCASCVSKVEKALNGVPGVTRASVNLATERAHVDLAGQVSVNELIKAVETAGYEARSLDDRQDSDKQETQSEKRDAEAAELKKSVILAALLTLPVLCWRWDHISSRRFICSSWTALACRIAGICSSCSQRWSCSARACAFSRKAYRRYCAARPT